MSENSKAATKEEHAALIAALNQHRGSEYNPQRFTKQPVTVDAFRLAREGEPLTVEFEQWCDAVGFEEFTSDRDEGLIIHTLEGDMRADPGDWIIKGVKGEFYPCKDEIFTATYRPADVQPGLAAANGQAEAGRSVLAFETLSETQSGYNRLQYATHLMLQIPRDHDGRNTWLMNYAVHADPEMQAALRSRPGDFGAANGQAAAPQTGATVQGYRALTKADTDQMNDFKATSAYFLETLAQYRDAIGAQLGGPAMLSDTQAAELNEALRWLAIARTDMQTACMAACRAVAKPSSDS